MLSSLAFVATTAWVANLRACSHPNVCARPTSAPAMSAEAAARAAWLQNNAPIWSPPEGFQGSSSGYVGTVVSSVGAPSDDRPSVDFSHAPLSYFALDKLVSKGPRREQGSLVDVGEPHDFTRPLAKDAEERAQWNGAAVGSWACTAGGWESPKLRPTTEVFLVLDGEGCVTDNDGVAHPFGAGDVVVLPKHWCGRWDISKLIHKVWLVHDHPDVQGAADGVVRAVIAPVPSSEATAPPVVTGALHEAPANAAQTIYDVGPTRVGFLSCSPGSFAIAERLTAESFFVVDGVFFLTNLDGSARRCTAGDTVVLPKGWSGNWNVIEPVRQVWVEVM